WLPPRRSLTRLSLPAPDSPTAGGFSRQGVDASPQFQSFGSHWASPTAVSGDYGRGSQFSGGGGGSLDLGIPYPPAMKHRAHELDSTARVEMAADHDNRVYQAYQVHPMASPPQPPPPPQQQQQEQQQQQQDQEPALGGGGG